MEKAKRYGVIAALLIALGLVGLLLHSRTQNGGQSLKDAAEKVTLRNLCIDGDKKACEKSKELEAIKP